MPVCCYHTRESGSQEELQEFEASLDCMHSEFKANMGSEGEREEGKGKGCKERGMEGEEERGKSVCSK